MNDHKYYTPEEISKTFNVKKATVYLWVREGKLKAIRLGNLIRISEEALQKFIEESSRNKE